MNTPSPDSPHDRFFRTIFTRRDAAADLVRAALPAEMTSALDLEHLTVSQDTFVDPNLRSSHSDLLLQIPRKGTETTDLLLYVLVEHKSRPERWTLLQLLGYMVDIWKRHRRDHPTSQRLPVIIPLVFSHSQRRWRNPLDFSDLVGIHSKQERRHTPCFNAALYETGGKSRTEIRGGAHFVAAVRTLHERQRMIRQMRQLISEMCDTLPDPSESRELLTVILAYLAQVSPGEKDQLSKAVRDSRYRPAEDAMMTIAEQWIAEGRQKGRVEGRLEGQIEDKHQVLTRQIRLKFGLSEHESQLITSVHDTEKLDSAIDAVITASDKTEIFALLR